MAKQAVDVKTKELELPAAWKEKQELQTLLYDIILQLDQLEQERSALLTQMAELESQGIEFFGTTYKGGKYLYKLYPSTVGEERKRVYVGADPEAIKTEMAKLDRFHEHAALKRQLDERERKLQSCHYYARQAVFWRR